MDEGMHYGKRDKLTGERWVYVSRAAAHAHPKGQMHWTFLLVVAWLVWSAIAKYRLGLEISGTGFAAAAAFLPIFIAVLVLLRAPIARILLIVLGGFTIYVTVKSGAFGTGLGGLADMLVTVAVTIWMWEGERPNLAFGYRFRSNRRDDEVGNG
ncbi:hypothetical protein RXV86_16615 [Alisedimentitalea sp. MJ-SS2]|uniref:hypothetical protein n=1 Tax=Aliisedimentitalea sp. MJ-SS2 TaxID=3049795 RepID=UPI00290E5030|nr:hypothetical protein [Alisedimentitalea sp. MJ-SS2]MDU8929018.1 hypothetical protein [Alisedimentitalea sp. MJ-SS2]